MTTWTSDELNKVGTAEELEIASLRRDGTLRNQVTIWVVRHGDDLYVRSVNGPTGTWFRGAQVRHEGHIQLEASTETSRSRKRTMTWMMRSTLRTARSTTVTPQALWVESRALRRDPRRSNSCRAQQAPSSTATGTQGEGNMPQHRRC